MTDIPIDLTKEEASAIDTLQRLGKRWPKSLWLFSASGSLYVMRKEVGGRRHAPTVNRDSDFIAATIMGIENDGGDF